MPPLSQNIQFAKPATSKPSIYATANAMHTDAFKM